MNVIYMYPALQEIPGQKYNCTNLAFVDVFIVVK